MVGVQHEGDDLWWFFLSNCHMSTIVDSSYYQRNHKNGYGGHDSTIKERLLTKTKHYEVVLPRTNKTTLTELMC